MRGFWNPRFRESILIAAASAAAAPLVECNTNKERKEGRRQIVTLALLPLSRKERMGDPL